MENNSQLATPVNLQGTGPGGTPIDVVVTPNPLPVTTLIPPYTQAFDRYGGAPKAESVIAGPCELRAVTGYVDAGAADVPLFIQLHELDALPVAGGAVPKVVIPVLRGGTYSLVQALRFAPGLTIALSTTDWTYTAAGAFLCWQATGAELP